MNATHTTESQWYLLTHHNHDIAQFQQQRLELAAAPQRNPRAAVVGIVAVLTLPAALLRVTLARVLHGFGPVAGETTPQH